MTSLALLGIDNGAVNLVVNLIVVCLLALWFALAYWAYADARRRLEDPMLIYCAAIGSLLFGFVGPMVWMIVRPPECLEDTRERELEMHAAEAQLYAAGLHLCRYCDAEIERDFLRCPSCMKRLKDPCRVCKRPLEPGWKVCPYCEAEVRSTPGKPRARRRRGEVKPTAAEKPAVAVAVEKPAVAAAVEKPAVAAAVEKPAVTEAKS